MQSSKIKTTGVTLAFGLVMACSSGGGYSGVEPSHGAPPADGVPAPGNDPTASTSTSNTTPTPSGDNTDGTPTTGPKQRALGTISAVTTGATGGCPTKGSCKTLTVSCPAMPDLQAVVAVLEPAGTPKGTIFVHGGGGGEDYYSLNVAELVDAGFRTAQVRWVSDWETTPSAGIKDAACRTSTVMKWVYDEVHKADTTTGFCAEGHSGGSAVLGYALAHYGAEKYVDYAALLAGPPFARLDYGCAPSSYSGPAVALCPELPNAPISLPTKVDPWENTSSCESGTSPASDIAKWAADSIVSPGADYDYPNTPVDFFDCATNSNGTAGGAFFYSQAITSTRAVHCSTDCQGEAMGPTGTKAQFDAMIASCKPHP